MSAALSVRLFLLCLVLAPVLVAIGGLALWQWWKERQRRQEWQEILERAQLYDLLNGRQSSPQRRASAPHSAQASGPVIVQLPAQQQPYPAAGYQATGSNQADAMAGFYPPRGGGWEVVE